jgi:hypothetical protein
MGTDILQFRSTEDGCVYFYDTAANRYRKICDVPSFKDLPPSVRRQIKLARAEAVNAPRLPAGEEE